jgi:hypothetical protein
MLRTKTGEDLPSAFVHQVHHPDAIITVKQGWPNSL